VKGDIWTDGEKPARQWCFHAKGKGCAIHDQERPKVCESFQCLWKQWSAMPDAYRPDRMGVLLVHRGDITYQGQSIPVIQVSEHYAGCYEKSDFAKTKVARNAILLVNYAHEQHTRFRNLPHTEEGEVNAAVAEQLVKLGVIALDSDDWAFRSVEK
jgi:hypothetical protein